MTQFTLGLTRTIGHGRAFSQVLAVPDPAADSGFTYTNDGAYWELVDLIAFQLVSDSNAGNRQVTLSILGGDGVALATLPAASVQIASKTYQYTWSTEFSNFNTLVGTAITSPLPAVFLQPTYQISVALASGHAGDQFSNIRVYAERFVTGDAGYLLGVQEVDNLRELAAIMGLSVAA